MANAAQLYLKQAQIGPMANFVYLIGDPATHKAAVVDPAWDVGAILDLAERDGYEIDKILITHYHPDHLGGSMMGRNVQVKFLHTPGHTPGSQCFLVGGNLISGDTLFVGSCGRVDLPGSDPEAMYYSLNHTLKNLDDATVVYPGHAYSSDSSTTIGKQKRHNMYMRFPTLDDFLDAMGATR